MRIYWNEFDKETYERLESRFDSNESWKSVAGTAMGIIFNVLFYTHIHKSIKSKVSCDLNNESGSHSSMHFTNVAQCFRKESSM